MRSYLAMGALLTGIVGAYYSGAATAPRLPLCVGTACIRWRGENVNHPQTVDSSHATDREAWVLDLLDRLGNAQPSVDVVAFVVAWSNAEDGSSDALDRHNPLNTTQDADGAWSINSHGVKGYPDYDTGMNATIETLVNGRYNTLVAGLQSNDVALALAGLRDSPWGTHTDTVESIYYAREALPETPQGAVGGMGLSLDGDCGYNVLVALDANDGALRRVVLQPGETFSFNATMGDPRVLDYRVCAGVPGGSWCNLAAAYSQVARGIGLAPQFQDHGIDLGFGRENQVAIWNNDGTPGNGQDMLITNTLDRVITFSAIQQNDAVVVVVE